MAVIAMVGDIFLQDRLPQSRELAAVTEVLQTSDIAFGNLEAPISERGTAVEKWINMRMSPELLPEVESIGFKLLTIANNHMMDYGELAFMDTLNCLDAHQIAYAGAGLNLEQAWQAKILSAGDLRLAVLAAAATLPLGSAAADDRLGIAPIHVAESYHIDAAASMEQPGSAPYVHTRAWPEDLDRAVQAIEAAARQADFVVAALHWGVPPAWRSRFQDDLADYQIEVGHALIEAGADLIVGHHPHSLQAVEVYRGKPIFYSLGNFLFHHSQRTERTIVNRNAPYVLRPVRDRLWSETIILVADTDEMTYVMHPVLLDEAGNPALLKESEARAVIERLGAMSPNANIQFRDGLGHLLLSQKQTIVNLL